MSYDNTKFYAAFDAWMHLNIEEGFGEEYAGNLMADFDEFLAETGMLNRTPGRVVFGKRLREKGFTSRKSAGLTYWAGLKLKKSRTVEPKRYKKTIKADREREAEREAIRRKRMKKDTPAYRAEKLDKFHRELEEEERRLKELEDASANM